jgi:hypothetical protein
MPEWLLNTLEVLCLLTLFVGVGLIYVPAALIVAGVLGVLLCEAAGKRMNDEATP